MHQQFSLESNRSGHFRYTTEYKQTKALPII